jgi:MFS transporter, ACDE family, multidrug resistance protein
MLQRRIPEWVRHPPAPGVRGFASLTGIEALIRGSLISVFPLAMYRHFGDAMAVSRAYLLIGIFSLITALTVPWLSRKMPRRWIYTAGGFLYLVGTAMAVAGPGRLIPFALLACTTATVVTFVCLNAYVLDYIGRAELGKCETSRMFYSAFAWTVGPAGGVWLMEWWYPAPFLFAGLMAGVLIAVFWWMRLGNGKLIVKARAPAPNPYSFLPRFAVQPRLVAGWLFAVMRSCGWWVYVVYLPIFVVESGMPAKTGGVLLSMSNALLFLTPVMLRFVQHQGIRQAVRFGFLFSGTAFILSPLLADMPWLVVVVLFTGSAALALLDICGGLPFLMAVKPSERTEMSAVYSTYRDVSGVLAPGAASLVLLAAPLTAIFAAAGAGLLVAWHIARRLHPRLGSSVIRNTALP